MTSPPKRHRRARLALLAFAALAAPALADPREPSAKSDRLDTAPPPHAVAAIAPAVEAPAVPVRADRFAEDVCVIIEAEAKKRGLPETFFARLIWRESLFDPGAVSPKGAEGIAQFMPGTARLRGLDDSFAPHKALPASAHFLADLRHDLGNLGLAAAGYNAGAGAVTDWLAKRRTSLPYETQDYVAFVTGRPVEDWASPSAAHDIPGIGGEAAFVQNCVRLVKRETALPHTAVAGVDRAPWKPWGVVVSGGFSEGRALLAFRTIKNRYPSLLSGERPLVLRKRNAMGRRKIVTVMVGKDNRAEADTLCSRLQSLGAACMVVGNRR